MKMIFFGSSSYVLPIIEALNKHFDLKLVITTEKQPTDAVPSYCIQNNIEYISVNTLHDENFQFPISNFQFDSAVLADFGLIVPQQMLKNFPKGIINIHPSLLPKYRGPTPVQSTILAGDQKTGVTIIRLDEQIDHGPILAQKEEAIHPSDTAHSLYQRLFEIGTDILLEHIQDYLSDKTQLKEQDHSHATYTKELSRADGFIDANNPPPKDVIERMTRAYYPWPGVWTNMQIKYRGETRVKLLPEGKFQVEGKKPVNAKDFINGYPEMKSIIEKLI